MLQVSVAGPAGPAGTPVQLRDGAGEVVRTGAIDHFGDRLALADLGVTDGPKGSRRGFLRRLRRAVRP